MRNLGFDFSELVYVRSQRVERRLLEIPKICLGNSCFYEDGVLFEERRYQLGEIVSRVFF